MKPPPAARLPRSDTQSVALVYGIMALILLLKPVDTGSFLDKYVVAIGLTIVLGTGLAYLFIAHPERKSSEVGEGDAIEVANMLRSMRDGSREQRP